MKRSKIILLALAVAILCALPVLAAEAQPRDVSFENSLAADLKALGLFSGVSDTNFDLERAPSRTEVLVMLIRVLGEEKAVKEGTWEHPFTDVAAWADPYVGYAYENGLTKGVSATKFGTDNASAATYLTFVLRALGYSDAEGDFAWDNPYPLAKGLGLLPSFVDTENFWRADIVSVSYAALAVNLKGSEQLLAEKLIDAGAFTAETYGASYDAAKLSDRENGGKTALTSEQIYTACSPAVFYIEVQSESGKPLSSGSGFFIDESGIAVTNYHVIEGAKKAVITLPGSGAKYDVTGVYDMDPIDDWAVIQVGGSNFKTLTCNALTVKGGSTVYAIGSPEGLQNTVSAGLVSNARRVLYEDTFIQTTAAISHGSSGGVLLNAYGEVIGITSNSITDGQNLNFARPIAVIAGADMQTLEALDKLNWNLVWYTAETQYVTLKAGETFLYAFDYDYYTLNDEAPELSLTSSDNSIATANFGLNRGTVQIVGNKVGEATIVISDNLSPYEHPIFVTVTENADAVPKVTYTPMYAEMKLEIGATKVNYVALAEYGIAETPDGMLSAEYTVKASNSNIKLQVEYADEGAPYLAFAVTAAKKCSGNIVLTNSATDDTLEIPVTVGDRYADAYEELMNYLTTEGEYYTDAEDPDYNSYDLYFPATDEIYFMTSYYPAFDEIYCMYAYENALAPMYVSISLYKDGTVEYFIEMPTANVSGSGSLIPKNFTGANTLSFEEFIGAPALRSQLAQAAPTALTSVLYAMDGLMLPSMVPGMSISDFGFVKVDFSVIGLQ